MAVDATEVDRLLAASQGAHETYRHALQQRDPSAARTALQSASDQRAAAQAADPGFTAPAWKAREGTFPHTALMVFYNEQLAK